MGPLLAVAGRQEKLLLLVAVVSWLFCVLTIVQSRGEVRANSARGEEAKRAGLEPIIVAPEALTAKGRRLRVRLLIFGGIFVVSVVGLAWLLARPNPDRPKTSSFVSFRGFRG